MNITRRIHLNPQSKGGLGKSFETEFRVAWLQWLGIPWSGSDLDDRHHTFRDRHPDRVQSHRLGNVQESKATLLNLFRRLPAMCATSAAFRGAPRRGTGRPWRRTAGARD